MEIGRRIYFDKLTGNVLYDSGESTGSVVRLTVEEEIPLVKVLSERVRESFKVIELDFSEFSSDFKEATSYKIDTDTEEILFNYESVEDRPKYTEPLSKEVARHESTIAELDEIVLELLYKDSIGGV